MKNYSSDITFNWNWLKKQNYIHSSDNLGNGAQINWRLVEKFPIKNIIKNEESYPNPLKMNEVINMIDEFYPSGFHPKRINENYELVDGQHRLKFAQLCGFEFIDVFIENSKELKIDN